MNLCLWLCIIQLSHNHCKYQGRASSALEAKSSRLRLDMSQKSTLRVIWWQNGFGGSGRGIVELRYGGISLGPWQPSINEIFSSKLKEAWILRFPEILIGYRCAPEGAKFKYATCRPPIVSLCLELEHIRDHFYYTNGGHLYSKSGLGFVPTPSIANQWVAYRLHIWIWRPLAHIYIQSEIPGDQEYELFWTFSQLFLQYQVSLI